MSRGEQTMGEEGRKSCDERGRKVEVVGDRRRGYDEGDSRRADWKRMDD